jgi:hypothetical protein
MLPQTKLLSDLSDHLLLAAHPVDGGTAFGVDWEPGSSVAPDASPWITAQACVALCGAGTAHHVNHLLAAFKYLEHVRSEEQGGWSYRPPTGCCITDVGAWVVLAQTMTLQKHGEAIDGHVKRELVLKPAYAEVGLREERA